MAGQSPTGSFNASQPGSLVATIAEGASIALAGLIQQRLRIWPRDSRREALSRADMVPQQPLGRLDIPFLFLILADAPVAQDVPDADGPRVARPAGSPEGEKYIRPHPIPVQVRKTLVRRVRLPLRRSRSRVP